MTVLATLVLTAAVAGCGAESPEDSPAPRPPAAATASGAQTSAEGVSDRDVMVDIIDAHLTPTAKHHTDVRLTLANTDAAHRHDLTGVTAEGDRATITGPDAGAPPGDLPLPPATHMDTVADHYTIAFPFRTAPGHAGVPVTFRFAGNPGATLTLPVLPR